MARAAVADHCCEAVTGDLEAGEEFEPRDAGSSCVSKHPPREGEKIADDLQLWNVGKGRGEGREGGA